LQGEQEIAAKNDTNILIKTFKLVPNGNSNESAELQTETIEDGLPHDEGEVNGGEYGLFDTIRVDGGSDGSDLVLSEDSVF